MRTCENVFGNEKEFKIVILITLDQKLKTLNIFEFCQIISNQIL
jgi:hypothetical protein